ncbi:hypothetical protein [Herbiconiux daphne]|uniref:Uncharacterized protein n=1 Tax=Herbiconiux daphne TaxID=2970914 RepID=A0ABT2GWN3_9MICO|nr:hypothetical protein [Herbiconiux daphne]MCS5732379.1 hypothetical protein [Herbiconiux daphne]
MITQPHARQILLELYMRRITADVDHTSADILTTSVTLAAGKDAEATIANLGCLITELVSDLAYLLRTVGEQTVAGSLNIVRNLPMARDVESAESINWDALPWGAE